MNVSYGPNNVPQMDNKVFLFLFLFLLIVLVVFHEDFGETLELNKNSSFHT